MVVIIKKRRVIAGILLAIVALVLVFQIKPILRRIYPMPLFDSLYFWFLKISDVSFPQLFCQRSQIVSICSTAPTKYPQSVFPP